jgi:D-cysteine desulfhydrase/L-cysteate sulfo-lyase
MTDQDIRGLIASLPRIPLACLPTPLQEAQQLTKVLGGPRIFFKRDDLTGMAFGGNKTRNLEFRLVKALEEKADVLIMALEVTSNSARQTVGAANRLGMKTVLVLKGERPDILQGNLVVNYLLGAEVHFAPDAAAQRALMEQVASRVHNQGKRPLILTSEPIFDIGSAIAYLECSIELLEQMQSMGERPDYLYMASGGKGQAGLVLAQKLLGDPYRVHGVTVSYEYDVGPRTAKIANDAAAVLGLDTTIDPSEVISFSNYVGRGYGIPTPEGLEAVRLVAQTEGILLDPIYTGKCMAAVIDHIRRGVLDKDASVVFIHTGGTPAIFSYAPELLGTPVEGACD